MPCTREKKIKMPCRRAELNVGPKRFQTHGLDEGIMLSGWKAKEGSLTGEGGGGEGGAVEGLQVSRSSKGTAWTAL